MRCSLLSAAFLCVTLAASSAAQDDGKEYQPFVAPASNEGQLAIHGFQVPEDMTAELIKHVTKSDLRDLVEYLAGLKGP